jgi:hypothetical protein
LRTLFKPIAYAALCSGIIALSFAASPTLAAPNANANDHANSGGNGNGSSNGNGGGGEGGGGSVNGQGNGTHGASSNSAVHQYVLATGQKQGDVASSLKSWNSLNANPKAFEHNLNNPHSLLGKEAKYMCDNASAQEALATFNNLPGAPTSPPTADEVTVAQKYLAAVQLVGTDPATLQAIVADGSSSSDEEKTAANLVLTSTLMPDTAQQVIAENDAWIVYQQSAARADASFAGASVSYKGATTAQLTQLRATVDGVIAQKGLDTSSLCGINTAAAQ